MRVNRERPSQRLNHRVSAPLFIWYGDNRYETSDWSLGGAAIAKFDQSLNKGDKIDISVELPFQGFMISFPASVKIHRTDETVTAAQFTQLPDREKELLRHFLEGLVRGDMTDIGETILRIDTPVTPVPTTNDAVSALDVPPKRWTAKMMITSALYAFAGIGVIGYTATTVFGHYYKMEIETAVVDAPIEKLVATSDGRLATYTVPENFQVNKAQRLISITNPKLEQDIDKAVIGIDRATIALSNYQKQYQQELARLGDYQIAVKSDISRLRNRINSLTRQVSIAKNQKSRFKSLFAKGWTTASQVDEYDVNLISLIAKLDEARLLMREKRILKDSVEQGRFFNGNKVEGRVSDLQAEVNKAADEIILAQDHLSAMYNHRARLDIYAPGQGTVLEYFKSPLNTVKKGEPVALFEKNQARTIKAFLTQEEVIVVGLGDMASAYFPSLKTRKEMFISNIDRTSSYVDEMDSRYEWRGPKDRSAIVTLQFIGLDQEQIRQRFSPGLPVIITFTKRSKSERQQQILDTISGIQS
jgi:multidrug resistance efflux pump